MTLQKLNGTFIKDPEKGTNHIFLDLMFLGWMDEEVNNVPQKKRQFTAKKIMLSKKEVDNLTKGFNIKF